MWNALWQCDKVILGQQLVDMAGAKLHLPFDDVEPLLFATMHMLRRSDVSRRLVQPERVGAVGVGAGRLKRDFVVPHPPDRQAAARRTNFGMRMTGTSSSKRWLIFPQFLSSFGSFLRPRTAGAAALLALMSL